MSMLIDRRDLDFQLYEWLQAERLLTSDRYRQHDRATFDAIVDAAEQLAQSRFADHAAKLDENEPTFDGERVHLIPEVKAALDAYIEGGFLNAAFDEELGGMQLPVSIAQSVAALFTAANVSTVGYLFLTIAAANMLRVVGSQEQKDRYLKPMLEGRFFGTMCLSEPQAGSSLGDIRTTAYPQPDGSYKLKGNKMWISGGEHDLSENIVHMVLAKIDGAPAGTKGISLFVVPKYLVNDDGSLGERNGVRLMGLNHKMGYRGTVNTALSFGDNDDCTGWLVGEANKGLAGMFHMMNEARIGVGLGAACLGYSGYLHSLDYARSRPQGRPVNDPDPGKKPVMIIEHADVKRMLMQQKSYVEGGMGLCLYGAMLVDRIDTTADEQERDECRLLLEMLTPVIKTWPSENCLEANKIAMQILGGYGYTRDYPLERLYRDNRLNPIHEGTTGIQGMDLLGRKVVMKGGAGMQLLLKTIAATADASRNDPELERYAAQLLDAVQTVDNVTAGLLDIAVGGDVQLFMANSHDYLQMVGHVVLAWVWLQQAQVAQAALDASGEAATADLPFYRGKLAACRYFFTRELPMIQVWAGILKAADDGCLVAQEEWF